MKKYTMMIMSDPTAKVRRIRITAPTPAQMISAAVVVVIVAVSLSFYFLLDYTRMKIQMKGFNSLRKENTVQRFQLQAFKRNLEQIKTELESLKDLDHKLRVMANLDKTHNNKYLLGIGGPAKTSLPNEYQTDLSSEITRDLNELSQTTAKQEVSFQELIEFFSEQKSILAGTPSIWPVHGWVTSGFGTRTDSFTGYRAMHEGLDIATQTGTSVIAPCDGIVTLVTQDYGYGKMLEINNGNGIITRYGHNSKIAVRVGDRVKRGNIIAYVGNTGRSTGPHLHYEVIVNGVHVNPMKYIMN